MTAAKIKVRTVRTRLSPEERTTHLKDWLWWRGRSRAGARAAFAHLREWKRDREKSPPRNPST